MDMEWAKDGETGDLYIVQARPETIHAGRDYSILKEYRLKDKAPAGIITVRYHRRPMMKA
jgi:pyruvate,water dikinase